MESTNPMEYLAPFWPAILECFEENEGLAEALAEAISVSREQGRSLRNGQIYELRPTVDVATQTDVDVTTRGTQSGSPGTAECSTQTIRVETWEAGTDTAFDAPYHHAELEEAWETCPILTGRTDDYLEQMERRQYVPLDLLREEMHHPRPPSPVETSPLRCFNCRLRGHHYNECPRPRTGPVCFRCGRQGVTVKDCPRCGGGWAAQGPYRPSLGRHQNDPYPTSSTRSARSSR